MKDYIFPWPASSPDMNVIEYVWKILKHRIQRRDPRPVTVSELKEEIFEEWEKFTEDEIAALAESMPERLKELRDAKGGHTKY